MLSKILILLCPWEKKFLFFLFLLDYMTTKVTVILDYHCPVEM